MNRWTLRVSAVLLMPGLSGALAGCVSPQEQMYRDQDTCAGMGAGYGSPSRIRGIGYVDAPERLGRFERVETEFGEITLFAGGASMSEHGIMLWIGNVGIAVPALILAFVTLLGEPWVTRWSLRSLNVLTERLGRVDYAARGSVVEGQNLPGEMLPVVTGINKALRRLRSAHVRCRWFWTIRRIVLPGGPPASRSRRRSAARPHAAGLG